MVNSQTVVLALRENQKIITRVRDAKGRQEYLLSKGSLLGYNAGRVEKRYPISCPQKWRKTDFGL